MILEYDAIPRLVGQLIIEITSRSLLPSRRPEGKEREGEGKGEGEADINLILGGTAHLRRCVLADCILFSDRLFPQCFMDFSLLRRLLWMHGHSSGSL